MKLLIAGSRNLTDIDISPYIPTETALIISGGANGVDALAEQYADKHRISKLILRPRYDLYCRATPLKRNDIMVDICDRVLIFWNGASKGTKHTIDYAKKTGKPVEVITINKNLQSRS